MKIITLILCLLSLNSFSQEKLNIVFIGNSITQGAIMENPETNSPPARTAAMLTQKGYQVKMANHGVSGSTTVDHLPQSETIFPKVKISADKLAQNGGQLMFSIMLGTNDSAISGPNGSPVSPVQYHANMLMITSELLKLYPSSKVIIHYPLWYSPNTYNSAMYLLEGLNRVVAYRDKIDRVVQSDNRIFLGDTLAFRFFEKNYIEYCYAENGNAGTFYLHPNVEGATRVAEFWSKAILDVVSDHYCPEKARSDAPKLIDKTVARPEFQQALDSLRSQIDQYDSELFQILSKRMKVTDEIGLIKRDNNVTILQTNRWDEIVKRVLDNATSLDLSKEFLNIVLNSIHMESLSRQNRIKNKKY